MIECFLGKSKAILKSNDELISYLLKDKNNAVHEISNVFKYVMPESILVQRSKDTRKGSIMCNYKCDIEHGIAVCYENEELKNICSQDEI